MNVLFEYSTKNNDFKNYFSIIIINNILLLQLGERKVSWRIGQDDKLFITNNKVLIKVNFIAYNYIK